MLFPSPDPLSLLKIQHALCLRLLTNYTAGQSEIRKIPKALLSRIQRILDIGGGAAAWSIPSRRYATSGRTDPNQCGRFRVSHERVV